MVQCEFFWLFSLGGRSSLAADRRSARRRRIDPQSIFSLLAELGLALAGFAGVASAFGGRDRVYAPIEIARLRSLFAHAFLVLANSLLAISLLSFDLDATSSVFWTSAFGALGQALVTVYFIRLAYGFAASRDASTGWGGFAVVVGSTGLSLLLFGMSTALGGDVGLLISALSVQLLFGLWVFMRLLVHRY